MSRSFLIPVCALALLLAGASEARRTAKVVAPSASVQAKAPAPKLKSAARAQVAKASPTTPKRSALGPSGARASKATPTARPLPRIRVKDALSRLPNGERRQMLTLIASPRTRGSVPVRRAVAAFLLLRGLKGGASLPITVADLQQMTGSKRWTEKRMANFAVVLRTAVGIAQAEGLSANAAFQKALKVHGIQKKYNRGVCGA